MKEVMWSFTIFWSMLNMNVPAAKQEDPEKINNDNKKTSITSASMYAVD